MFTLVAYIITTQLVLFFFIYTSTTESYTYRPTLSLPDSLPICYAMMTAIKTAERRLAKGTLLHAGGQLMAWTVGNLKIEPTATAIRATKANAGDAKIDVAMALFNAVTVMSTNPEPKRRGSYLENDEIIVLDRKSTRLNSS